MINPRLIRLQWFVLVMWCVAVCGLKQPLFITRAYARTNNKQRVLSDSSVVSKVQINRSGGNDVILPEVKTPLSSKLLRKLEVVNEGISDLLSIARRATSKIQRDIKIIFSSDFESLLLRLTTPDQCRPPARDVQAMMDITRDFVSDTDLTSESNPYRITLRKIWAKISEPNPLTSMKGLVLLHTLIRESDSEDGIIFKALFNRMSSEMSSKTNSKYFDVNVIRRNTELYTTPTKFLLQYAEYVFIRGKNHVSKFHEMRKVHRSSTPEDSCAHMLKASKMIDSALQCNPLTEKKDNDMTDIDLHCLELIALDLRDVFHLFKDKLQWLMGERLRHEQGIFKGWEMEEVDMVISHFSDFFRERYSRVTSYVSTVAALLDSRMINIPSDMPGADLQIATKENLSQKERNVNSGSIGKKAKAVVTTGSRRKKRTLDS